jgi:hypothetical protein
LIYYRVFNSRNNQEGERGIIYFIEVGPAKSAKKAAAQKKRDEEYAKKAALLCRGEHPAGNVPKYKATGPSAANWMWCEFCEEFGMCPECYSTCTEILDQHEASHCSVEE